MGGVDIRGFLAFAAAVVAIAYLWARFDESPDVETSAVPTTTTSAVTTTLPEPTSTDTAELAIERVCDRAQAFQTRAATLPEDAGDGPVVEMAAEFWAAVLPDLPAEARTEAAPVASYYESFVEVGRPFDFDPSRIIVEGDKNRYQQLLTQPALGLENSRGYLLFVCGVEVPDKPSMSSEDFSDLEDRLLDSDPLG